MLVSRGVDHINCLPRVDQIDCKKSYFDGFLDAVWVNNSPGTFRPSVS